MITEYNFNLCNIVHMFIVRSILHIWVEYQEPSHTLSYNFGKERYKLYSHINKVRSKGQFRPPFTSRIQHQAESTEK